MATYFWVNGSGSWDATSTANWSNASGGASGFGPPTSADNVIFDAASNTGTDPFTVTVTGTTSAPAVCNDFSTGGAGGALDGAMTLSMGATAFLDCYGSLTLPATNFTWSGTTGSTLVFRATTTGKTLTTNGVTLTGLAINFDGGGGGWTLGSALTLSNPLRVLAGSFNTGNYNITGSQLASTGNLTRSITLGSSTITLSATGAINLTTTANLTFNAGTSQITCSASSPTFTGDGLTFYNVSFTSTASGQTTITGANTFNDLTQASRTATGRRIVQFNDNQTISGTLTLGASNTSIRRIFVVSNVIGTQRTITLNGTLATLADVDFRDINAAGTVGTWTGTRIGNGLNNSGITFDAPKNVYRVGTGNWSATQWSLSSGGSVNANNFPLAQDTAIFDTGTVTGTHTFDQAWLVGTLDCSALNVAVTFATSNLSPTFFKNLILDSDVTLTGTANLLFQGQGTTQTITSAGVSIPQSIIIESPSGTVQLLDNTTTTSTVTLTAGTLDLNDFDLTCNIFSSSNSNTRSIDFGTGEINLTGNDVGIWNTNVPTNFSYTGTPTINCTYSGSTGTRTITTGATSTEAQALNFNISAGSDTITTGSGTQVFKNLNFTGFTGTLNNRPLTVYGNLIIASGMTLGSGTNTITFSATSGTQQITTNAKTLDFPVGQNSPGATLQLQDNLTMGSTRTFTLTAGTLDLSSGNRTLSCGLFSSSNSNTRAIAFGTGDITLTGNAATVWTTSTATNFSYTGTPTVNATYSGSTGTRTFNTGNTEANSISFNISAGTDIVIVGSATKNLNFTGFSGTLGSSIRTIYGNLTFSSLMTVNSTASSTTFAATSGTQELTTNGKTLDFPITINGVGGTVELQDALTMGSTRTLTLTNGTFTTNDYNVTTGRMLFNTTGTRAINMGSSAFTINGFSGAGIFWNVEDATNLTINAGTSTINLNRGDVSEFQGFFGNGFTYHNLNIANSSTARIFGNNTFNNISNTYSPVTIQFEAGATQTVNNFTVSGTPGNLITLASTVPGSIWYLTKTSGTVTVTYCDISDSDANGGATFNCINGVNSGNNTGWNFSSSSFSSGNFLAFF